MSEPIDLYLTTTSAKALLDDLASLGLVQISPALHASPVPGVSVDYIGKMVKTPAVYDPSSFPPKVVTEAVWYDGERANVRLTGDLANIRAAAIRSSDFANGTTVPAGVAEPKRTWAS